MLPIMPCNFQSILALLAKGLCRDAVCCPVMAVASAFSGAYGFSNSNKYCLIFMKFSQKKLLNSLKVLKNGTYYFLTTCTALI